MSPLAGLPPINAPLTVGAISLLPSTLWLAEFAIAAPPRPKVAFAVPPRILIVPPFSANAPLPTLIPSVSLSDGSTM